MTVEQAYRRCEAITRTRAANFYYGIRLLPAHKRRAMCAVYAFARRVDDIGDGDLPLEQKLRALDAQARALGELLPAAAAAPGSDPASGVADEVMVALRDAAVRFSLPRDALDELIEGVRMDVRGVSYERFEELVVYCRRVAGVIGRLCLSIFAAGARPAQGTQAQALADDLGVAMQLTNILRDLREDAENGRVYVPGEDLRRFGLLATGEDHSAAALIVSLARRAGERSLADGNGTSARDPQLASMAVLVRFEAERAQQWFDRGITLVRVLDRRSAACVLAMAGIYQRLLGRIAAHPEQALQERLALPVWEKAWVAAGSMLAADPRLRRRRAAAGEAIGGGS
jgi:phytoene synthase